MSSERTYIYMCIMIRRVSGLKLRGGGATVATIRVGKIPNSACRAAQFPAHMRIFPVIFRGFLVFAPPPRASAATSPGKVDGDWTRSKLIFEKTQRITCSPSYSLSLLILPHRARARHPVFLSFPLSSRKS